MGVLDEFAGLAARLARAREQGFDTSRVWYHGTSQGDQIAESGVLNPSREGRLGSGVYVTPNPEEASRFAELSAQKTGGAPAVLPLYRRGSQWAYPDVDHPRAQAAVSPSDLRSVNAAFDPARRRSRDLLAGAAGAGILGAAAMPEEAEALPAGSALRQLLKIERRGNQRRFYDEEFGDPIPRSLIEDMLDEQLSTLTPNTPSDEVRLALQAAEEARGLGLRVNDDAVRRAFASGGGRAPEPAPPPAPEVMPSDETVDAWSGGYTDLLALSDQIASARSRYMQSPGDLTARRITELEDEMARRSPGYRRRGIPGASAFAGAGVLAATGQPEEAEAGIFTMSLSPALRANLDTYLRDGPGALSGPQLKQVERYLRTTEGRGPVARRERMRMADEVTPDVPVLSRPTVDPESLVGRVAVPVMGDRSITGGALAVPTALERLEMAQRYPELQPPGGARQMEPGRGGLRGALFDATQAISERLGLNPYTAASLAEGLSGAQGGIGVTDVLPFTGVQMTLDDYEEDPGILSGAAVGASVLPGAGILMRAGRRAARRR